MGRIFWSIVLCTWACAFWSLFSSLDPKLLSHDRIVLTIIPTFLVVLFVWVVGTLVGMLISLVRPEWQNTGKVIGALAMVIWYVGIVFELWW